MQEKIVFAGLDKGGKTSIIESFLSQFTIVNPLPTAGIYRKRLVNLDWLGFQLTSWDLGGQQQYRNDHFKNPSIFLDAMAIFYIIDIQETDRYELAIDFLQKIMDTLAELNDRPELLICFNKFDPDLSDKSLYLDHIEILTQKITNMVKDQNIHFFNTSIYEKSSILNVLYHGVIKNSKKGQLIENALKKYAQLTFSSASVLLDDSSLIVGSQSSDSRYLELCKIVAPWFSVAMEKLERYNIEIEQLQGLISVDKDAPIPKTKEERGRIFAVRFETSQKRMFTLVSYTRNKRTSALSEKYLPELSETMRSFIEIMNN